MVTASEKRILRNNLEKYEGSVPHMYLDTRGYVTVGVGYLLSSLSEARKLPFKNANNKSASKTEIKTDYETVKKQAWGNNKASFYKKHTKLTLPNVAIDKLTNKHIDSFEKELKRLYTGFSNYPSEVRLALFDMIFNLGMTRLRVKYVKFNAAITAKDWQKAATQSNRLQVDITRNKYVKDLLNRAANKSNTTSIVKKP